jgi:hypothetical protein
VNNASGFQTFEFRFCNFKFFRIQATGLCKNCGVTETFQRMMDRTTEGLEGVFVYMDDSRVGSPDRQTHLLHLEAFFNALATHSACHLLSLSPILHVHHQSVVYIQALQQKSKKSWTQTRSGQRSIFVYFANMNICSFLFSPHSGFPILGFFLEFPCSCLGCFFFCSLKKHVSL